MTTTQTYEATMHPAPPWGGLLDLGAPLCCFGKRPCSGYGEVVATFLWSLAQGLL